MRRTDAETVPSIPSNTTTSNIQVNRTARGNAEDRNEYFNDIFYGIESFSGALADNTVPKQIANKTKHAVGAYVLDPSTYRESSKDTSDINSINAVTPEAAKPCSKTTL